MPPLQGESLHSQHHLLLSLFQPTFPFPPQLSCKGYAESAYNSRFTMRRRNNVPLPYRGRLVRGHQNRLKLPHNTLPCQSFITSWITIKRGGNDSPREGENYPRSICRAPLPQDAYRTRIAGNHAVY
jgi:hypothetical protein